MEQRTCGRKGQRFKWPAYKRRATFTVANRTCSVLFNQQAAFPKELTAEGADAEHQVPGEVRAAQPRRR